VFKLLNSIALVAAFKGSEHQNLSESSHVLNTFSRPIATATLLPAHHLLRNVSFSCADNFCRSMADANPGSTLGKHTCLLYNSFKRTEAGVLAQLRTGMSLYGYLYRINAAQADLCACGQAKETVEHFIFRCTCWDRYSETMPRQTNSKMGCLSFFLGRKALSDPSSWKQSLAIGRLALETTY
jgi:hypothetical protein